MKTATSNNLRNLHDLPHEAIKDKPHNGMKMSIGIENQQRGLHEPLKMAQKAMPTNQSHTKKQ
jgi:hypothetical protein